MTPNRCVPLVAFTLVISAVASLAAAEDWPAYRHDNRRSGVSGERLTAPLSRDWTFTPAHGPDHAWDDPQPKPVEGNLERPRMRFDDAFHVAAVGDMVYFASSSEDSVRALDAATGRVRWTFYADGPVRLAPTVWEGKVYFGSDDGKAYCVDARTGRAVWTFAAAPRNEKILGNGRMISVWPVRTGVLVDGGVAYFGAGVFPAEGLFLYAVNAKTGALIWTNDSYERRRLGGVPGDMEAVSPQGYLLASADRLFVASGRSTPAAFYRADGRFAYHRILNWRGIGTFGGTYSMLAGDLLLTGAEQIVGMTESSGEMKLLEAARRIVVGPKVVYVLTGDEAVALDRDKWRAMAGRREVNTLLARLKGLELRLRRLERAPKPSKSIPKYKADIKKTTARIAAGLKKWDAVTLWRTPCKSVESMALTARLVFAGGANVVTAFDAVTGQAVWSAKVGGKARGIAAAGGRLLVSTDTGAIHCFVPGTKGANRRVAPPIVADPFGKAGPGASGMPTAAAIAKDVGARKGYALILGGTGRLALELARRTNLRIHVANADPAKVAAARKALTAAGVYGAKVVVMQSRLDALPFADYFANVIVCPDATATPAGEVLRMLKPCGGVAYVGKTSTAAFRKALAALGETQTRVTSASNEVKIVRGELAGAGRWDHQYGEPGNTACGDDRRVKGPIGLLWYGEPGPGRMPSRHASAAAPLAFGGRMFVQGENVIWAYDAYNGAKLWQREIPGAIRVGLKTGCSNFAGDGTSVYVAVGPNCLRLDAATGKTLRTYASPPARNGKRRGWDYLACAGGLLYGSGGRDGIFAVEIATGKLRWRRDGGNIMPSTIAIGDGRVFFVDRALTDEQTARGLKGVPKADRVDQRGKPVPPDVRLIVALDAGTGKTVWARPQYVSDCVVKVTKGAGEMTLMTADNVVLLCGQPWNGHFWREFFSGAFSRRSLIALSGGDGRLLWSGRKGYRSRPLIIGDRIIAEPWAYDLHTGAEILRPHPITGAEAKWQMSRPGHHCGNIAAAPNMLLFRSGVTAYYDLAGDYGTAHFGAQRSGCWINCIPANGLVLVPEASSGCVCPFSVATTVVFAPRKTTRAWGMFSAPGALTPVERLSINFGAPGDRKDSGGAIWLAHPRPRTDRLVIDPKLSVRTGKGGGFLARNGNFVTIAGTDAPWVYASGLRGPATCSIPLLKKGDKPRKYTVRLHFAEPRRLPAGKRVFDVLVQGKPALTTFDIAAAAGGPDKAVVKQVAGVAVTGALTVELKPAGGSAHGPVLCGIEVIAEK